jgi:hypothetical protein
MAERGLFQTSDLVPLPAERGVHLSREQAYRLVTQPPQRLLRWSCEFLVASTAASGFLLTSIPAAWCVAGKCDARWSPG